MKRTLCAALCLFVLCALSSHAADKKTLAVMNFESTGDSNELAIAVSEIVRSEIAAMEKIPYVVVERAMLNSVMKEQELSLTGVVSEDRAVKVGRLLSAENLVMGKIIVLGSQYRVTARIVETETSVVRKETYEVVTATDDLPHAAKAVAWRLFGKEYTYTPTAAEAVKPAHREGDAGTVNYSSVYTDGQGMHTGGRIVLTFTGTGVTGYSDEPGGRAEMTGTVSGDQISGMYRAPYGYGNYTFRVSPDKSELVGDYYQVSNGAHGDWIAVKGEKFRLPKSMFSGKWKTGDRVLVKWSKDAYWYPATVAGIEDNMYSIEYLDGDSEFRFERYLQAEKLGPGDAVFGNWQGKGKYFKGKITARNGDDIHIKYDDGDQEDTTVSKVRVIRQ
jgi:hypothetical protein